jgi:hypothetical protein
MGDKEDGGRKMRNREEGYLRSKKGGGRRNEGQGGWRKKE